MALLLNAHNSLEWLQVEQGMPKIPDEVHKMMVKNAADGVPLLTNDIVKKLAKNNLVFVTCADWGHYDFALNWAAHLRELGITNFLIGAPLAADPNTAARCIELQRSVVL